MCKAHHHMRRQWILHIFPGRVNAASIASTTQVVMLHVPDCWRTFHCLFAFYSLAMFLYHDDELHSALIEKSDESAPHPEAVNSLHTPRRGWQLPRSSDVFAKLLTAILVVNVAGYTILTLLRIGDIPASNQCGLKTDALFGNSQYLPCSDLLMWALITNLVPWHEVVLENDEEFMHTDPENFDDGNTTNIWTDIYPGMSQSSTNILFAQEKGRTEALKARG